MDDSLNTRELVEKIEEALAKCPPAAGIKATIKVQLHPDPCPRCGGKQAVNQVQHIRTDLPEAMCLDFDCYLLGRRDS